MILKSCKADGQVVPLVLADLRSLIHKLAETGEQRDLSLESQKGSGF